MKATIYQLNIKPETPGERGLPKKPVEAAYVIARGIVGDFNKYRHEEKHDNPNMALLLLPLETIQQLNTEGWPVQPGDLGENITTHGIPYNSFAPGKRYALGNAEIEIAEPCTPCRNLAVLSYVGKERCTEFMRTLLYQNGERNNRRGWYARVLKEGEIKKGETIEEIINRQ